MNNIEELQNEIEHLIMANNYYFLKIEKIRKIAETYDYWNSNLTKATEIINKILEIIKGDIYD